MKDDLREKGLSGEEVYDRAAWRRLSSHIDPPHRSGIKMKRWADCVKDDLREKGLSGEEVYDRAAWRRLSSHIDPS